jgi:hypothetical protein
MSTLFSASDAVYYQRQAELLAEREYFHWITAKALNELAAEGKIGSERRQHPNISLRFYWSRSNRYWRRKANEIEKIVLRFSQQPFTKAVGMQGELMIDAALPRAGLIPMGTNVREWKGKIWETSNHDLDRVYSRDGIDYGVEIKNTLGYIDRDEFVVKLRMCEYLRLRPLFVMRFAPKSYMDELNSAQGFGWLMGYQFYPFGEAEFARKVQTVLGIKVDTPRALAEGTIVRLSKWLERQLM